MLLLSVLLAGCGGGGSRQPQEQLQSVDGPGFAFRTPRSWEVDVAARSATAKQSENTLVSVTVLPLARTYRPELFAKVAGALDEVAATLADRLHGTVTARRTIEAAGRKARQYQIAHGSFVDLLTFVLRGKKEFLLTCRWQTQDGEPTACADLLSSFRFD